MSESQRHWPTTEPARKLYLAIKHKAIGPKYLDGYGRPTEEFVEEFAAEIARIRHMDAVALQRKNAVLSRSKYTHPPVRDTHTDKIGRMPSEPEPGWDAVVREYENRDDPH